MSFLTRISPLLLLPAVIVLWISPSQANAGIITTFPDISTFQLSGGYTYDNVSGTGVLDLEGFALSLATSSTAAPQPIYPGLAPGGGWTMGKNFEFQAVFDSTGALQTGFFEIRGAFGLSDPTVTLLRGTLKEAETAFDTNSATFLANGLSGQLQSVYGEQAAVLMSALSSDASFVNFMQNFSVNNGQADTTRAVPEPATIMFFIVAFVFAVQRYLRTGLVMGWRRLTTSASHCG